MENVFEKDGQKYLRIGSRAIPFQDFDAAGRPIIKPRVEHSVKDGKPVVTIHLPSFKLNLAESK